MGFQAEHLYQSPRLFVEMQPRLNDLRVVEHHQAPLWQIGRQMGEGVCGDVSVSASRQELRGIALCERIFCNPFVGQRIIVVADMNMFRVYHRR